MPSDLFFEIGTEEIPARFLPGAIRDIRRLLDERLREARVPFGEIYATATPRRLVGCVRDVSEKQEDEKIERLGPPWKAAFDEAGKPTKAGLGFAKSQGVDPDELSKTETDGGTRVIIRKVLAGRKTADLAPEILKDIFQAIPWSKSMRWGNEPARFVRPVQWILAMLGAKKIDLTFAGVRSSNRTFGHRFHSPKSFAVKGFDDYLEKLEKNKILLDFDRRRRTIADTLGKAEKELGGKLKEDEELLDHVTGLVEWPVLHVGSIPEKFMDLPEPVLTTSMREHQKYFCFLEKAGKNLLPKFGAVAGVDAKDKSVVTKGYERVLEARLADARFFFSDDLKVPLPELAGKLDQMVFHRKLGNYKEKISRDREICSWLADRLAPDAKADALRALLIAKADLLTQMVGEFPKLQGVIGREYALRQGESALVADAIFEHYLPRFSGDKLPEGTAGALASLSDKMDSVVACLGVGLGPTGSGDPYALRRQSLGIVQILLEKKWSVDLKEFIQVAARASANKTGADVGSLTSLTIAFFHGRLSNWLKQRGLPAEVVDGALAVRFRDLVEVVQRAEAVTAFAKTEEYEAFSIAFKRVVNIIGDHAPGEVNENLFSETTEIGLWEA